MVTELDVWIFGFLGTGELSTNTKVLAKMRENRSLGGMKEA